jgi:hypothetical protein
VSGLEVLGVVAAAMSLCDNVIETRRQRVWNDTVSGNRQTAQLARPFVAFIHRFSVLTIVGH